MTSTVTPRNQALTQLLPPLRRACHLPGVESQKVVPAPHPISIAKRKESSMKQDFPPKVSLAPKCVTWPPLTVNLGKQQRIMGRP